jgi:hypothetical protein
VQLFETRRRRVARRCLAWSTPTSQSASWLPKTRASAAVVCHNIVYDVPLPANIVWRDARTCRTLSTRCDVQSCVDHRCRSPCAVAPPPSAPSLPTMYQYSLSSFGGTSADFGQCRLVEARCAVSTIDVAASARWCRLRVRQRCLRCTSTRCRLWRDERRCRTMSTRRGAQRWTIDSLPVHDGAAVVCAKVAYDVPVLAVVEWRTARRCLTMSTRRGARCSVDHRPVAASARWHRRRVRQGCLRCTSTRCRNSAGRAQMSDNVDSSRRVVQCRPSTSLLAHGGAAADCAKVAYDVPVLAVVE